jgi:signal transduction histidine kinase
MQQELEKVNANLHEIVEFETTKRLEKEKLLIQQTKMATMGEMIGAIAHQWKQPLNTLAITLQDVEMAYQFNELNDEYLAKFKKDAMHTIQTMSNTIEDFKNFFSPNKKLEEFFVEDAIAETLKMLEPQLRLHNVEIIFDKEATKNHRHTCYKNELKQVLLNIIANAKDALFDRKPQNPFIKIDVNTLDNNRLEIAIEDSAGGVPEEIIDRIFDSYFTTKGEESGTGIGLYMSKQIVEENLHGKISVSNTDNGARFSVRV